MPKRSRRGAVRRLVRVVAPTRVKRGRVRRTLRAAGTLADDQVELEILHRGIKNLLHGRRQPMDLVDEEDISLLEVGEHGGEVTGAFQNRAR